MSSTFNILMYSHDTYGLGHIRRTMAIANHLLQEDVNILILTGSPIVGRFEFPQGIDFVRVPGMIKQANDLYVPHSIKVDVKHAMDIRKRIITATAKAFKPGLFIVDKAPLGLKREVLPILKWFRKCRPETHVVLGLRDIMDDAAETRKDWRKKKVYEHLENLYTEIWVYGDRGIYDQAVEYDIPGNIAAKMIYTGYIPRRVPEENSFTQIRKEQEIPVKDKLVVVTPGGGGDGFAVLDNYLKMLEANGKKPFRTVIISGPFLPPDKRNELAARAKALGVPFHTFYRRMEKLMGSADLIVGMGGYNTICEILSLQKVSLIIPRETPRLEQTIRAKLLQERGLLECLPWGELSPDALYAKIMKLLENPAPYETAIEAFPMTGLDVMRGRLAQFMNTDQSSLCEE